MKTKYHALVESIPFNQSSVKKINNWIENATENEIKDFVKNLNPNDSLIILNAVYFKGLWESKFN